MHEIIGIPFILEIMLVMYILLANFIDNTLLPDCFLRLYFCALLLFSCKIRDNRCLCSSVSLLLL